MKKIENFKEFKELLENILLEIEKEKVNSQSLWRLGEFKPDLALGILDQYQVKMSQGMRSKILNEPQSVLGSTLGIVASEITELLRQARNGEIYLDEIRGKNRRLASIYYMTDTFIPLGKTPLGIKLSELQELYRKL